MLLLVLTAALATDPPMGSSVVVAPDAVLYPSFDATEGTALALPPALVGLSARVVASDGTRVGVSPRGPHTGDACGWRAPRYEAIEAVLWVERTSLLPVLAEPVVLSRRGLSIVARAGAPVWRDVSGIRGVLAVGGDGRAALGVPLPGTLRLADHTRPLVPDPVAAPTVRVDGALPEVRRLGVTERVGDGLLVGRVLAPGALAFDHPCVSVVWPGEPSSALADVDLAPASASGWTVPAYTRVSTPEGVAFGWVGRAGWFSATAPDAAGCWAARPERGEVAVCVPVDTIERP